MLCLGWEIVLGLGEHLVLNWGVDFILDLRPKDSAHGWCLIFDDWWLLPDEIDDVWRLMFASCFTFDALLFVVPALFLPRPPPPPPAYPPPFYENPRCISGNLPAAWRWSTRTRKAATQRISSGIRRYGRRRWSGKKWRRSGWDRTVLDPFMIIFLRDLPEDPLLRNGLRNGSWEPP